jgi:hypothetical protein
MRSLIFVTLLIGCDSAPPALDLRGIAEAVVPVLRNGQTTGPSSIGASSFGLTYGSATDWMGDPWLRLQEIIGDPAQSPMVVTKMMIILYNAQNAFQDAIDHVNGGSCQKIPAGTHAKMPWFDDHAQAPFFGPANDWPFQCRVSFGGNGQTTTLIGRGDSTAKCGDPHVYYVMSGWHFDASGGPIDSIILVSYDKCAGDVKIAYAMASVSASGAFTARSELTGNVNTHAFSLRAIKLDRMNGNDNYYGSTATGVSQVTSGSDSFIISYRHSESIMPGVIDFAPEQDFCLGVSPQRYQYTPMAGGCSQYEAAYAGLQQLDNNQLPTDSFNSADFGF